MASKIYGDLSSTGNIQINGSNTIREINDIHADTNGDINIPYYNKQYIDNIINMIPITRVGTQDYLPINVSGSHVGATSSFYKRGIPTILENDGTLVIIRPGTNGSSQGYYYAYVKNAKTVDELNPIQTNLEYIPSFFTNSHVIDDFISSKSDEVLMMQTYNGTDETYTIALTNSTFNQISHQYLEFNRSLIPNTIPNYVHIVDGVVYIWCIDSTNNTDPYSITLFTINVSDVINGLISSLKRVNGISGKNIHGSTVNESNNIIIADRLVSQDGSANSFISTDSNINTFPFYITSYGTINAEADYSMNNIRVSLVHELYYESQFGGTKNTYGISFNFNKNTKEYTFDNMLSGSIVASLSGETISITNPYAYDLKNYNGWNSEINSGSSIFQADDGVVLSSVSRFVSDDYFTILRTNISNFTNLYDSLNVTSRITNNTIRKRVYPQYGSAIGSNLINPTILSSSRILISCSGTENGVTFGYDSKVYTDLGTSTNYEYKSVVSGSTITGFAPNENRHKIDNYDNRYSCMIQLITADGKVSVYGSTFLEGNNKPTYGLMNINDFSFSTTYSLQSSSLLTNLKNSIISNVNYPGTVTDSKIVLYYVPDNSFGSSIAITTIITSAKNSSGYNGFVIVSKVDVTMSGDTITVLSSSYNNLMEVSSSALGINYAYISRMSGLVIAKYSDFSYIGIPGLCNIINPSDSSFRSVLGKLDASNNFVSMKVINTYILSTGTRFEVGVLPGIGFGLYANDLSDFQTKLVFKNCGTSSEQLDNLITNPNISGTNIVIASQDVPKGFNIYFTQIVPVLINGSYYKINPTTINLSTIDPEPSNKTFYVYIINIEGTASYSVSTTQLSEELWRVFIGTIVTGETSISSINIEKVTRFLTYRTSTTKRGSAIPTSTGVPSGTGTRWK